MNEGAEQPRTDPPLNPDLVREVTYIAQASNHISRGRVDHRTMARDIARLIPGPRQGKSSMSEEGLAGIMEKGVPPKVETLRTLAAYMQRFVPQYSVTRLFVAAHYESEEDVRRYAAWRWPAGLSAAASPALQDILRSVADVPEERLQARAQAIATVLRAVAQADPPDRSPSVDPTEPAVS